MTAKNAVATAAPLFLLIVFFPSIGNAQRATTSSVSSVRAPQSTMSHARTAPFTGNAPRVAPRAIRTAGNGLRFDASANGFVSDDGVFVPLRDVMNSVPSQFFDYSHLGHERDRDRFRNRSRFSGNNLGYILFDGGGYYVAPDASSPDGNDSSAGPPQPQVIVVQAPQTQPATDAQQASEPAAQPETPLTDVGQFTLVLQSGKLIEAIAFTRANDRIVYITADGSRHTMAVADLDADATMKINQERGTPLELAL